MSVQFAGFNFLPTLTFGRLKSTDCAPFFFRNLFVAFFGMVLICLLWQPQTTAAFYRPPSPCTDSTLLPARTRIYSSEEILVEPFERKPSSRVHDYLLHIPPPPPSMGTNEDEKKYESEGALFYFASNE